MEKINLEKLIESNYWGLDSEFDDNLDKLSATDLGLLMYKLIEKNVQHDAEQRHKMYDVLCKLEKSLKY